MPRASSTPTRSATRRSSTSSAMRRSARTSRSSSTSPTPRRTGRCTRTRRTSPSTRAASTPAGTQLRQERLDKLVASGLLKEHWKLTERDPSQPPWSEAEADAQFRAWTLRCMEVYAAQIDRMDQGIGRILAALEKTGQLDDTLVIFLADNGACAEDIPAGRDDRRAGRQAHDRAAQHAQRRAGALRQRHPAHARAREHLPELRHRLGQPLQFAVSPLQALDPRGRHLDAADRPLAERHRREGRAAPCAGLPARHHGDDHRRRRRLVPGRVRGPPDRAARRPDAAAGVRRGTASSASPCSGSTRATPRCASAAGSW